jgi:hypothetical protein
MTERVCAPNIYCTFLFYSPRSFLIHIYSHSLTLLTSWPFNRCYPVQSAPQATMHSHRCSSIPVAIDHYNKAIEQMLAHPFKVPLRCDRLVPVAIQKQKPFFDSSKLSNATLHSNNSKVVVEVPLILNR